MVHIGTGHGHLGTLLLSFPFPRYTTLTSCDALQTLLPGKMVDGSGMVVFTMIVSSSFFSSSLFLLLPPPLLAFFLSVSSSLLVKLCPTATSWSVGKSLVLSLNRSCLSSLLSSGAGSDVALLVTGHDHQLQSPIVYGLKEEEDGFFWFVVHISTGDKSQGMWRKTRRSFIECSLTGREGWVWYSTVRGLV